MSRIDDLENRVRGLEMDLKDYQHRYKIQECPYCRHYTLQYYSSGGVWVCVTCGNELRVGMVLKGKL